MKGLKAKRVRAVKEGTLIATVDIGVTNNTGYCTTLDGRSTKSFKFDNTKGGFEKFWGMTIASKNRFGCDELKRRWTVAGTYLGFFGRMNEFSWSKIRDKVFKTCLSQSL